MRPGHSISVAVLTLLLPFLSGCVWTPELDRVRKDIESQLPGVEFKREVAFSLGPIALSLARTVVNLVPDAREAASYLEDIRDLTVAVYEVDNIERNPHIRLPGRLKELLRRGDWELTVKACEEDESVWVLSKTEDDGITGVYVVALDRDSLVLLRAHGRLESLLKKAIREHAPFENHA